MRTWARTVTAIALASLVGSALPSAAMASPDIDPRIINGTEATIEDAPWQVGLLRASVANPYHAQFCGGSVISAQWVLTAAHCVDTLTSPTALQVAAGVSTLPDSDSAPVARYGVSRILIHPDWNADTNDADLALLRLAEPLPLDGTTMAAISVPDFAAWPEAGTTGLITGWGNSGSQQSPAFPTTLRKADVAVLSDPGSPECGNYPPAPESSGYNPAVMLCAGTATAPFIDTCQGDSGGPLAVQRAGRWYLAGITSWGRGCAEPGYPGIYTRVTAFADWIRSAQAPGATGSITVTASGSHRLLCAYVYNAKTDTGPIASRCGDAGSSITVPDVFPGSYYVKSVFESIYDADTWYSASGAALDREGASTVKVRAPNDTRIKATTIAGTAMSFNVPADAEYVGANLCVEVWAISAAAGTSACFGLGDTSLLVPKIPPSEDGHVIYVYEELGIYASYYYTGAGQTGSLAYEQALVVSSPIRTTTTFALTLTPAARISGTVTSSPGYESMSVVSLYLPGLEGAVTSASVEEDGSFSVWWLPPGTYLVQAIDIQGIHKPQWWDSATSRDGATAVTVTAGSSTSNITMTLAPAGSISGTVTGPDGAPLSADSEVVVVLYRDGEVVGGQFVFDEVYSFTELDPGDYQLEFRDEDGVYEGEFYDQSPDLEGAQTVTVRPLEVTSGIDASLSLVQEISITASRKGRGARSHIVIKGTTVGLAGSRVTPWIKVAGAKKFAAGRSVVVRADGTFTAKYKTPKAASVYVGAGSLVSSTVKVSAAR